MANTRLDKFLANAGAGTRSEVKTYIKKGRVSVNGQTVTDPNFKFEETGAEILFDGTSVAASGYAYYLLHKPAGCVTAVRDVHAPTVMDYLKEAKGKDLAPVGRLDKDTEGLLLITNDGTLAHQLLSPRKHVPKTYEARISGIVTAKEQVSFAAGLDIGDEKPALPAVLKILETNEETGESLIRVTVEEGRFHQVKRMFHAVGMEVVYLKRLSMGPLILPKDLKKGAFRPLTKEELFALRNLQKGVDES